MALYNIQRRLQQPGMGTPYQMSQGGAWGPFGGTHAPPPMIPGPDPRPHMTGSFMNNTGPVRQQRPLPPQPTMVSPPITGGNKVGQPQTQSGPPKPPEADSFHNADDFYAQYGPNAAPLREALGFEGQNDVDMMSPSRISAGGGSDGGQGDRIQPSPALQRMIDAGQVSYGNLQNHDPSAQDAMGYWVNWDKLPKSPFGSAGAGLSGYDPSMKPGLFNTNMVTKDPNYGWVTPTSNVDHELHGMDSLIYNAAPALAIGAMTMGAGIPSLISSGMRGTQMLSNVGSGHGFNPMSLAAPIAGAFGAPSWATGAAGAASSFLSNAGRRQRRPRGRG
jgi:hypothetical protein